MDYLQEIKNEIQKILDTKFVEAKDIIFSVDIPTLEHGDATTNICLVASKVLQIPPRDVYEKIQTDLQKKLENVVEKIEFANPGFINFKLKKETVREILNPKTSFLKSIFNFGKRENKIYNTKYYGKNVLVEHSSPNLFKPFTVGHLMNNFTGEFLIRVLTETGATVKAISYPSDISIGIAKAIYIIKNDGGLAQEIFSKDKIEIVKYLGECYVRGVAEYKKWEEENNEEETKKVKNISNNLYANVVGEDLEIYEFTKKINLDYLFGNLKKLGSEFDGFIFESEAGEVGKKIVLGNTGELTNEDDRNKIFKRSEGAVVYIPSDDRKDINTTVFINSEGNPTYAAKDIGLLDLKFEKYPNTDFSFYVTDNEQIPHFKTVFAAAGEIKKEWRDKSIHVPHGRMTFRGAKMSSRLGGVPESTDVIGEVLSAVKEKSGGNLNDFVVALSALRVSILRSKPGSNIDFDPEKATSFEGETGPYLCYSFARGKSILKKAQNLDVLPQMNNKYEITNIERKVLQFTNILETSAEEIAPQKLVKYLFELAGEFNHFYNQEKIIDLDNLEKKIHNLYLTKIVNDTLKKGLFILGIEAPEEM